MYDEVVKYIKEAKEYGLSDREIKQNLLNAGWEAELVEQAFVHARAEAHKLFENKDEDIVLPQAKAEPAKAAHEEKPGPVQIHQLEPKKEQPQPFQTKEPQVQTASPIHMEAQALEGHHQEILKRNKSFQKKLTVGLAAVLILAVGGYFFYTYVYANPAKVWNQFVLGQKINKYHSKLSVSYLDDPSKITGKSLKNPININAGFNMESDTEVISEDNINIDSKANVAISAGETQFQQGMNFKMIDDVFYLKISDIPQLKDAMSPLYNIEGDWIKIDYKKLQEELKNVPQVLGSQIVAQMNGNENILQNQEQAQPSTDEITKQFQEDLKKIWGDSDIWGMEKYLGTEKINGVKTAHFKNYIDKEKLKNNLGASFDLIFNSLASQLGVSMEETQESTASVKETLNKIIDKIEVKEFETWVGVKDFQLYKLNLTLSAPSINSIANGDFSNSIPVLSSAQAKSRDAKRLADMRQMASALELYFNDKNGYPDSLNGVPQGISPFYIGIVPTAPAPADGNCTDYYNTYWYEPKGEPVEANGVKLYPEYEYTFCLGDDTGGYNAGIAKMTYSAIEPNITCDGTAEQCSNQIKTGSENSFSQVDFTAEFKLNMEFSNYGQEHDFVAPEGAVDIYGEGFQEIQASSERDSKRLATITQMSTGLELYFFTNENYPNSLEELSPEYGSFAPAPIPADGICTDQQNQFIYKPTNNNQSYEISFCLGSETGNFSEGVHKLSPTGIQ